MTKVRKGGATNVQIFDAIFPDCAASESVHRLSEMVKQLAQGFKDGTLGEHEEIEAIGLIVKSRREIQRILSLDECGTMDSCSSKEATDGTPENLHAGCR